MKNYNLIAGILVNLKCNLPDKSNATDFTPFSVA